MAVSAWLNTQEDLCHGFLATVKVPLWTQTLRPEGHRSTLRPLLSLEHDDGGVPIYVWIRGSECVCERDMVRVLGEGGGEKQRSTGIDFLTASHDINICVSSSLNYRK